MRKPVEALRVVSNEFLHETRAPLRRRWQPRLFSRRFNSPSRFSRASSWEPEVAFLLAGHSSRTGASNPFRIGRCNDDIQVNVKERESEILVSISSRWLAWVRFFFHSRASRSSSRRKDGTETSSNAKCPYTSRKVSRSDVRNLLFRPECTWALENTAKICNHFRLHCCRSLCPHP